MLNNIFKKIFFFIILLVLLIGIVSATEVNNNTETTITTKTNIENNSNTITGNTIKEYTKDISSNERINKKIENNTKTAGTKTVYVKTSSELINELTETNTTSTTKTINLKKGTYYINTNILLKNQKYNKITINGNNSNVQGTYNTQFLNISSKYDVTLNQLNIKYFKNSNSIYNVEKSKVKANNTGAIANYGKLTIKNSSFGNNKYTFEELNKNAYPPLNDHKNLNEKYPAGAAALYNKGTAIIENTKFNNNNGYDAGAIYNKGTMTIKTSSFTKNYGYGAGAISNKGTLTIDKSDFISNTCSDDGLAAGIRNEKKLTITNSNFKKNKGYFTGGIYNFETLTVKNTLFESNIGSTSAIDSEKKANIQGTFKNNRADGNIIENYGDGTVIKGNFLNNYMNYTAVICNFGKNVKVIGNFSNNVNIKQCGGAIYHRVGSMEVQGVFKNNTATDGGAIINFAQMTIKQSTFINNKARKIGGAVYVKNYEEQPSIKIYANFTNNYAPRGGAIYIDKTSKSIQIKSNFTKNHATYGGAIYNNAHKAVISGTFNNNYASNKYNFVCDKGSNTKITVSPTKYKYSKYGGAIYNKGNNVVINIKSTQKTKIEQLKTKITVNNIPTTKKGTIATISGKFTDELGNVIKNTKLTININGKKYTTKTDNNGKFTYKYKTTKDGSNKVTVSYAGNASYIKSSTQKTFSVENMYKTITLPVYKDYFHDTYKGNDFFQTWYTYYVGADGPGVCVRIFDATTDDILNSYPEHVLTKAVFYFKNSKGKTITRTVTHNPAMIISHDLITGYTPYKIVATFRPITLNDIQKFERGPY